MHTFVDDLPHNEPHTSLYTYQMKTVQTTDFEMLSLLLKMVRLISHLSAIINIHATLIMRIPYHRLTAAGQLKHTENKTS